MTSTDTHKVPTDTHEVPNDLHAHPRGSLNALFESVPLTLANQRADHATFLCWPPPGGFTSQNNAPILASGQEHGGDDCGRHLLALDLQEEDIKMMFSIMNHDVSSSSI